jgi:PAS domain S-box-containing protein
MLDPALQNWLQKKLFEIVPQNLAIIDRDYKIVAQNRNFQQLFGSGIGKPCFEIYKKRNDICSECAAAKTFKDGQVRVNDEEGKDRHGRSAHYLVHMVPVTMGDGEIPYIIEMSTDISEIKRLQREYQILFEKVPCYIAVLNRDYRIVRANEYLQGTFGATTGQHCWEIFKRRATRCEHCPAERTFADGETHTHEEVGFTKNGEETYYIVTTTPLSKSRPINRVIEIAVDVNQIHQLEKEKLDAERLAAVGQTVAGLAHGIKNILTGLEGGIYIFKTGLDRSDHARMEQGWQLLDRNIERISNLTKNLLSFSKGQKLNVQMVFPAKLVEEVVNLFKATAQKLKINLRVEIDQEIAPAPFDPQGIHSCLSNLVSNALDACQMSDNPDCHVIVRCLEKGNQIIFEVEDHGCGIDYDVKQKLFTSFFTTKGDRGTGLGLLVTKKVAQEHGGKIQMQATPGESTQFRLVFARDRLPKIESGETPLG